MPYDYRTVLDQYDMLHDAGVVSEPLEKWSARKNLETGNTGLYDAGLEDNFIKRASVGVDRLLEATGLPDWTEPIGRYGGRALEALGLKGAEEEGAAMGRNLPRMAVNYAPMALVGTPLAPLGIAATAGLSGAEAYTATGSPASGLFAAGTNVIMPGASNLVRQYALKKMGANLVEGQLVGGVDKLLARAGLGGEAVAKAEALAAERLAAGAAVGKIKEYIPKNLAQGLLAGTAENVAGSVVGGVGGELESLFSGQEYEWSPTTELLNMTVGQLPFAATAAFKHGRAQFGGHAARQHEARLKTSVDLSEKAIEQHELNQETTARNPVMDAPETPEQIAVREARVTKLVDLREKQRTAKADGNTVAEEERQKWADEDNATLRDQGKRAGHILGVPLESIPKRPLADPASPLEDPVIKLQTAEQRLAAVKDNVDLQDAIVEVNEVRERYGLTPIDDVEIALRRSRLNLGGDIDSIQSHIDETKRLNTAKEQGVALKTEIDLKKTDLEHPDPMVRAAAVNRLSEIAAASDKLDNAKRIANDPLNRDNAPIKHFQHEQAIKISESDPGIVPEDKQKFVDWASGGVAALRQKHGMDLDAANSFLNDNALVNSWRSRLEMQVKDGLTIKDYSERHLKNQGMLETEAQQRAEQIAKLAENPDLVGGLLATPTESAAVKKAGADMTAFLAQEPELTQKAFTEQGVTNADELYNKFVSTGKIDEDALIYLNDKVTDYVYAKAREHQQLVRVLHGAEESKYVNSPVDSAYPLVKSLGEITDIENRQAKLVGEMLGVGGVAPQTFMKNVTDGIYGEPLAKVLEGVQKIASVWKTPNWIARFGPIWQEFSARGHQLSPNIRKMSFEAMKAFGVDEQGNFKKEFVKAVGDKQITGALSKWMGINNRIGSAMVRGDPSTALGVKVIPPDHPDVAKIFQGLPEEKHRLVRELMARQVISTKRMFEQELGKTLEVYSAEGTKFLNERETGFKYDKNLNLSSGMLEAVKMSQEAELTGNQEQLLKSQEVLGRIEMELLHKPGLFTELQTMLGGKLLEYNKKKAFFDANPAWSTSQGYGKYSFIYLKGNKEVVGTADSRAEAKDIAGGNQITTWERNIDYDNTPVPYERQIPPQMADARWFNNHMTWLNKNATYWSRKLYREQSSAVLADPETSTRPDLKRLALQHRDNMLSPDPKFGQEVNKFASMWYLGFNPASAMANATQLWIRGAAEMTNLTGNPIDSYRRVVNAYKEMYNMYMPGAKGISEEKQRIVKRLEQDGITTVTAEMSGQGEYESGADLKRILSGRGPLKNASSNLSRVFKDKGMMMFRAMERVNNTGAVFAAYDYYRGKGLDYENAYQQALQFNRSVNDVGGKANRPIDVMSGTGEVAKSLGLMATSMQTYNIGSIGQIAHYIKDGFFTPKDMLPSEKYHHKMALGHLLVAQGAAAGALGLPFIGTAIGIADQVMPSLHAAEGMRDLVNGIIPQFLSDDEEDGGTVADIALLGIPSAFGWDMQSRLSMASPVAGIDEINGFQPELLLGVPWNLAGKFLRGGIEAAQGKASYVGNMMPPMLKKQYDLLTSGGKVRDYDGKPILTQPTPGETVGLALGFQPTEVSEMTKANRAKARSEEQHRNEDHAFNQKNAQELIATADFGAIRRAVKAKLDEEQAAGREYDWQSGMRKIAATAEELYFPKDFRRGLNQRDALLAKHFKVPMNEPTEAARSRFKEWALTNLGVQYKPKDRAKYELMDRIEQENPGQYNRTEKRRLAEKAMGRYKATPELTVDSGLL